MIPRWDPAEGGRLHSEDIKSTDALHWLHHSSVSSLYLCVFFCIQLHWLGVKSADVLLLQHQLSIASIDNCDELFAVHTFLRWNGSYSNAECHNCAAGRRGRKSQTLLWATWHNFYGRFWQEVHIFVALDVIRIHLNAGTSRIQNCKHSVFVSVFLYLFSRIFVHIYIIYRLSTSHLWQVTFRPVKIHIGLQPPFCTIRIRKDNSNQLHLMCNVCVDSKARFQGKFNISIYR